MTVVSNTSPLCYLALIGHLDLLPRLFGRIAIPAAVLAELDHPSAPEEVRALAASLPPWIDVHEVASGVDPALSALHPGEREAIQLAGQLSADLILIDEAAAREVARSQGLLVTGMLGLLAEAVDRGMVDAVEVVSRLTRTNFRVSPRLLRDLMERRRPSAD